MSPFDGHGRERAPLRLGFVSGRFVATDGGGLYVDRGLGRLIDALGAGAAEFTVALSAAPVRTPIQEHRLAIDSRDFVALPEMPSVRTGFHRVRECLASIREVERRSDVIVFQLPFTAPGALLAARTPRVYHVCADQLTGVQASPKYGSWQRPAALLVAHATDRLHRALARRSDARLVTHGTELLERYGGEARGRSVVSSTLLRAEMGTVSRTRAPGAPFRVLFSGYPRPEKGIDVLLAAFDRLVDRLGDAELLLIGPEEARDPGVRAALAASQTRHGSRIRVLGHRSHGPELFACYADADVLALPSLSEGTPRVLVEARAFGCPVVATRVGGIPASVEHGRDGLLVPPGDAAALADALHRIATEPALRAALVAAGHERAQRCTLEAFANTLLDEAHRLAPQSSSRKDRP